VPSTFNVDASTDLDHDKITENEAALRQIMRLRGFSLMTNILQDHAKDVEVTILVCFHFLWASLDSFRVELFKGPRSHGQVASHSAEQGRRLQDQSSDASLCRVGERGYEIVGAQGLFVSSVRKPCMLTSDTKLLEYWDSLEVAYRIPKRLKAVRSAPLTSQSIAHRCMHVRS
jgi:hypothetical protein